MAANLLVRRQHAAVMLAVLVILSLGATVALAGAPSSRLFQSPPPIPPPNDNFANATLIETFPYTSNVNTEVATTEGGEPMTCESMGWTVWYKLTPTVTTRYEVTTVGSSLYQTDVSIWQGTRLETLSPVTCSTYSTYLSFAGQAGLTYYIQLGTPYYTYGGNLTLNVSAVPAPPPNADFYWSPYDPSKYDNVSFCDNSYDPVYMGFSDWWWDFGSGATATGYCANHQFGADGDYSVWHKVQTSDGRIGDVTKQVAVRTHDVAITKFTVPQSASAGQTRQIVVGLRNYNYVEEVTVELEKSVVGGYYPLGVLRQQVPVRSGNRTTDFNFSYTFTKDDAKLGKVTFHAVAIVGLGQNMHDALPADNEAISSPVKVAGK